MRSVSSVSTSSRALAATCRGRTAAAVNYHVRTAACRAASTATSSSSYSSNNNKPAHLRRSALFSATIPRATIIGRSSAARGYASDAGKDQAPLRQTGLYGLHLEHGAKMVPFAGFDMPVQYASQSVSASHNFTRSHASLFDVGHMVQRIFSGPGAASFLQTVSPADLEGLGAHHSTLSALLHRDTGGIVDDTVMTRIGPEKFYVVTNAGCRDKDDAYFAEELGRWQGEEVVHEKLEDHGLVALQGPLSEEILAGILADPKGVDLHQLYFGKSVYAKLKLRGMDLSLPVLISRGGYTGEDGFEISIRPDDTVPVVETLLAAAGPERLQLAGLGARDSLRLEAGMCLYGHDLDDSTTPVEAGLSWIIPKERRSGDSANFHGAGVILGQLKPKSKGGAGVERRRVGLVVEGAPAREGAEIASKDGERIGVVTSGCPSPTLVKNIAMGYIRDGFHKAGTEVDVVVRGRNRKATVAKMPFVPSKYWKGTASA